MTLIDSHAHLNFSDYGEDLDLVIKRARESGVDKIINIGTSVKDSEEIIKLVQRSDDLFATVGIHPNDDQSTVAEDVDWEEFENLTKNPKVVAIGEIGLDYSRGQDGERQKKLLARQLEVAKTVDLPVVLHIRDAQDDLISNFGHRLESMRGVFHCFSGDENYLNTILRLLPEFYVSFAGNLTFKNAGALRELAKLVPLERLLVETDSPFLTPEPSRGARNEPQNVKIVAEKIAEIKGVGFEVIAQATSNNAIRLFAV